MSNPLEKVVEIIVLALICLIAPIILFKQFGANTKQKTAETITASFLKDVSKSGIIDDQMYQTYASSLANCGGFRAVLSHTTTALEPFYGKRTESEIDDYYESRNILSQPDIKNKLPDVSVEDASKLHRLSGSSAAILANLGYPLSGGLAGGTYRAVVPSQEVYVGEPLITLLYAEYDGITYCSVGDTATASTSGTFNKEIFLSGAPTGARVNVTAFNRTAACNHRHSYPATKEVIDTYILTGEWKHCPYCAAYALSIVPNDASITVALGTEILPISFSVTFMDGHTKTVSYSDVESNFDSNYAGVQTVTIAYCGKTTTFQTETKILCSVCGSEINHRCYADCQTAPKCSNCMSGDVSYLGECFTREEITNDTNILSQLSSTGSYDMGRGDFLTIEVWDRDTLLFRSGEAIRRE